MKEVTIESSADKVDVRARARDWPRLVMRVSATLSAESIDLRSRCMHMTFSPPCRTPQREVIIADDVTTAQGKCQ
jgi:hypothetical protein